MLWGARFKRGVCRPTPAFLQKRIARIWPLHVIILSLTIGFALVIAVTGRPMPEPYKWSELPHHIVLVQNWGFTPDISWNDPSWSISTELAAYLLFAAVVPLLPRPKGIIVPLLALLILVIALNRFFATFGATRLDDDIAFFGLVRCITQFGCGVAMCMIWQLRDGRAFRALTALVAVAAAAAWLGGGRETLFVPIALTALVGLLASTSAWRGNPLSSRLVVFLGEVSYSTYLGHFLLWTVFKLLFVADAANVPLLLGFAYLAFTFFATVILYQYVEVPARNRLSRPWGRAEASPKPA
jgi:peptidoglycan/LPS O-acetylase OafA/YrhL